MTTDESNLLEQRGWHRNATLQRFKTFHFSPDVKISTFAIRLLSLEFSRQVHMQVTPKEPEQTVEVYIGYKPHYEEEVCELLFAIENVYNDLMTPDN